jgi:aromatic-L-amino-acid decarboxylase
MWISLQLLGIAPFRAALEEKVLLCNYFYEQIQKIGFEVGPQPDLSIAIFRYVPKSGDANDFNQKLVEQIKEEGQIFLSSTTIDEVYWIRFAVLSFRTHKKQVDLALQLLKENI